MRTTAIIALLLIFVTAGCRDNRDQTAEPSQTPPIDHSQAVHPEGTGWEDDIELDNGYQWQVTRETSDGIGRMNEMISNRSQTSAEDYRELGNRLEEERNRVQERNTTEDTTNNNLNIYMEPLREKIQRLQQVDSPEEGEQIISEIEQHLHAYSDYFV